MRRCARLSFGGLCLCLGLLRPTDPALAAPDWRAAGGDLFVAAQASSEAPQTEPAPARLAPLRQPYAQEIEAAAKSHGLDPNLLHAIIIVESAYQARAVSPAGAVGLMQLMPAAAADEGLGDRRNPAANVLAGADLLTRLLVRYRDLRLALAAYNAGPGRVSATAPLPNRAYAQAVIDCFLTLSAGQAARSARQCPTAGGRP